MRKVPLHRWHTWRFPAQHKYANSNPPRPAASAEGARRALPLVMFPLLAAGDLLAIYNELRSIHLRTLNKVGPNQQWVMVQRVHPDPAGGTLPSISWD